MQHLSPQPKPPYKARLVPPRTEDRSEDTGLPQAAVCEIAREMEQLTPNIETIGGYVQAEAIPYVYAFIDLAETIIQQEGVETV